MNDRKFLAQWEKRHKQGLLKYIINLIVPVVIVSLLSLLFFSYKNGILGSARFFESLRYNLGFIVFYSTLMLVSWFVSEKKYIRLMNERTE